MARPRTSNKRELELYFGKAGWGDDVGSSYVNIGDGGRHVRKKKMRYSEQELTDVVVVGTDDSLAPRIAKNLGVRHARPTLRVFPDGESKVTMPRLDKNTAVIVQSMHPPVDSNLMRILSMVAAARECCKKVIVVVPYMGYARQDRRFVDGEVVTAGLVGRLLREAGSTRVITCDIHSLQALWEMGARIYSVSAAPDLAKFIKNNVKDPLVVSPDAGGLERVKEIAGLVPCDAMGLKKTRDRATGKVAIATKRAAAAAGRNAVLVDDMISTGGSIIEAAALLKMQGCASVHVVCTHALLVNGARKIFRAGVSSLAATNTVPGKHSRVDVSGILSEAVRAVI